MGAAYNNSIGYTNSNRESLYRNITQIFEQFDDYGNLICYYQEDLNKINGLRFRVCNPAGRVIGIIETEGESYGTYLIRLFDENYRLINHIQQISNCSSIIHLFYDSNNSLEGRTIETGKCLDSIIELFDKYETRTNHAIYSLCSDGSYSEYDQNNNLISKIFRFTDGGNLIKMYDSNNKEISLANKTLFNKGFSKIQMVLIFRMILAGPRRDD